MANVLKMSAVQFRPPIVFFVFIESDDFSIHFLEMFKVQSLKFKTGFFYFKRPNWAAPLFARIIFPTDFGAGDGYFRCHRLLLSDNAQMCLNNHRQASELTNPPNCQVFNACPYNQPLLRSCAPRKRQELLPSRLEAL